ncbi:EscU/YscU/HrcU family type III secretion system export apparatus switch protein [Parerythrobacter lacustris]|uniref:EscU/YscU/HrcU family type III secretion system export apparatus switch protein n=1 Tax=Parerythrobacter lacustris TaxID=2969984 RepID=A0ABT1XMA8_9SPHN|nr:EscU/YscU/HrcU family type III secretion system export apparatus switch protein [Parerythrobacter lacustris]MCR2832791.1 EscU/YscU/HrcU family type III secretion system export apparatus switch protein [Parerythrobacter lacustris]
MSERPAGERSHAPTEKRLRDAIGKGNVLRSREVATAAAVGAGALWLKLAGSWMFGRLENAAQSSLSFDRERLERFEPGQMMQDLAWSNLVPVLTLGLAVIAVTLAAQLLPGRGAWVIGNVMPKASRIDPFAGLRRMFGAQGWIELGKSLVKLALLGAIAWYWGVAHLMEVLSLGRGELTGQLSAAWDAMSSLLGLLAAGLLVIALGDWPIQYVRRISQLRMTGQELRDEHKEQEGAPEKKAAIRQRQRDMARGSVAPAMQKAQFVLTNPSHFAVAMAYDPAVASAPYVLAKGRGEKALAMRELAQEMAVPTLEYPVLARAVYFTTREQQMIRAELYSAIASVLAFVMSLKRGEAPARPTIDVPLELHFDAEGRVQVS